MKTEEVSPEQTKRKLLRRRLLQGLLIGLLLIPVHQFFFDAALDLTPGGRLFVGAAYSPDGRSLALVSTARSGRYYVELRDARTLDLKWRQRLEHFPKDVAFSPDGRHIAIPLMGRDDPDWLCIVSVDGGQPRLSGIKHAKQHRYIHNVIGIGADSLVGCVFSDGIEVFDAADGSFVRFWQPRTGGFLKHAFKVGKDRMALISEADPTNPRMRASVQVWNVSDWQRECRVAALSDDREPVAAAGRGTVACLMPDLTLGVFSPCSPAQVASLDVEGVERGSVYGLAVSPDGGSVALIFSPVDEGPDFPDYLRVYDVRSARCILDRRVRYTGDGPVFTPDSWCVLVLAEGKLLDTRTGHEVGRL